MAAFLQSYVCKKIRQQGLKLTKKFCGKIRKFSRNFAKFSRKIVPQPCVVSVVAKQIMSPQYLC